MQPKRIEPRRRRISATRRAHLIERFQRSGLTRIVFAHRYGLGLSTLGKWLTEARAGMLSLSPATRIFVALSPMDMRAGYNRLYAHVQTRLNQDPWSGHLFVFINKLRNRIKVLHGDGSGLWVCAKRLERGSFGWPSGEGSRRGPRPEELQLLLHGMEGRPRRHWYRT